MGKSIKGENRKTSTFVSIEGSTNINHFELTSNTVYVQKSKNNNYKLFQIKIPVHQFKSTNQNITSDFRELVKAKNHPVITITIDSNEVNFSKHLKNTKHANGTITLAGVPYKTQITYTATPTLNNKFEIKGNVALTLSNFNLQPPKKLFGTIKVHNRIFVNFVFYTNP